MADVAKLLKELLPTLNEVFEKEILISGVIQTNLPADNFGFWLTQGVPFGLIFIHLLMAVLGNYGWSLLLFLFVCFFCLLLVPQ